MHTNTRTINATILAIAIGTALAAAPLAAQAGTERGSGRNELTITAEPVAAGLRYLRAESSGFRFGASLTVGPLQGVTIAQAGTGNLDEWATLHVLVGNGRGRLRATAGPGATLAIGDDFGSLYPSGRVSVEWAVGRFRLGSSMKAMRIAGPYGSGDYWVRWIPIRVGIAFGSNQATGTR